MASGELWDEAFYDYYAFLGNVSEDEYLGLNDCENLLNEKVAPLTLGIIVTSVGLLLNVMLIFAEVCFKVMDNNTKNLMHSYLFNILIGNTFFCVFVVTHQSSARVGEWKLGESLCKLDQGGLFACYHSVGLFLLFANISEIFQSVQTNQKILNTSKFPGILSRSKTAIIWIVSLLLNVPLFMYATINQCNVCILDFPILKQDICNWIGTIFHVDNCNQMLNYFSGDFDYDTGSLEINLSSKNETINTSYLCRHNISHFHSIWLYVNFSIFYIPLFFVTLFFLRRLTKRTVSVATSQNNNEPEKKKFQTCLCLGCISFCLCWFPWQVLQLAKIKGLDINTESCNDLTSYTNNMAFLFPFIMAVLYGIFHKRIRKILIPPSFHFPCQKKSNNLLEDRYHQGEEEESKTISSKQSLSKDYFDSLSATVV